MGEQLTVLVHVEELVNRVKFPYFLSQLNGVIVALVCHLCLVRFLFISFILLSHLRMV
jgi:hypothetical protein